MNAIPALIAGVKRIVLINPGKNGNQNPAVLYAAKKCKISEYIQLVDQQQLLQLPMELKR